LKELQASGIGLAAISYDSRDVITTFVKQHGITFPMLSDTGSATIRRYGILNTVADEALGPNATDPAVVADFQRTVSRTQPAERFRGIAFPGTFMLDRQGRVTSRFFEDVYVERNTVSSILKRSGIGGEQVSGTKIATMHLDVTTYPSESPIGPGNRFAVVLEIAPKRGIHVYAPGAAGYRIVSLKINQQPSLRSLALTYPGSEIYDFKPLNERVPVYQKPFTLVQQLVLEGDPQSQAAYRGKDSIAISGALEYQACDDKVCYNPVTLPLSWTVALRQLVVQQPTVAR
jgi:peroxiredoxin